MILIVDDNPTDIELTRIALEATAREIPVRTAADGKSALAILKNSGLLPSLVLLDLKMPGMGGLEVLQEIRADQQLKELPVIVVTTSSIESDKAAIISAGANGYIQKPSSIDRFIRDLEPVLSRWLPNLG